MIVFSKTYNPEGKLYMSEMLYRTTNEVANMVDNINDFNMDNVGAVTVNTNERKIVSVIKYGQN